jgi:HPt (histidine-containing phosphotransfer) domain-containing protein
MTSRDGELEKLRDLFHSRLELESHQLLGLRAALMRAEGDASSVFEGLRACSHRLHGAAAIFLSTDIARAADALEQAAGAALTAHADNTDAAVWVTLTMLLEQIEIMRARRAPSAAEGLAPRR